MKSKSILPMVATSEDTIFIFTVYKKELFQNSRLTFSHAKKNKKKNKKKKNNNIEMQDTCQQLRRGR